jgi:phage replication O-like protein O
MSTPQLERGFVRIANELLEAILGAGLSHREQSVVFTIIRKTYGFGKKEDDMSAAQIGALCGVPRQHVTTTLNALAARNVITKRPGTYGMIVGIQKDHRKWISADRLKSQPVAPEQGLEGSPESGLVPKQDMSRIGTGGSPESGQVDSPKSGHTKDNLPKDNHQKKTSCAPQADRDTVGETPAGQKGRAMTGLTAELQDRFDRFYAAYPLKKSRGTAEKAFGKLRPDDELVAQMLAGLEQRKASGTWIDPRFIPYPASWLNAKGWLDEVQTEYSPAEREVIEKFNDALGEVAGVVSTAIFVPARAAAIREFVTFSEKPGFVDRIFPWVRDNATIPPSAGFDWLISRKGFADVAGGQHNRKAA